VHNRVGQLWRPAAQLLLGSLALGLLTLACFHLQLNLAATAFGYLIVIVLLSLMGSFVVSVILSIMAVGYLNYFFAPPLFNLRVDYPLDTLVVIGFLTASLVVAGLVQRARRLKDQFQLVVDSIPAVVWSKGPDGTADFLNQYFQNYTGISAAEGRGWGWMKAFHPDDRATHEWRAALAAGAPFEKEARLRRADGQYRWFAIRAVPLRDTRGHIVKWYGMSTDIDDRRLAEARVRQAEKELRLAIDTIPALVWTALPDGSLDFINQRWAEIGLSLQDLRGSQWTAVIHPAEVGSVTEHWNVAVATGQPYENGRTRAAGRRRVSLVPEPRRAVCATRRARSSSGTERIPTSRTAGGLRMRCERASSGSATTPKLPLIGFGETGSDHRFTRVSEHRDTIGVEPLSLIGTTRWDFATDLESEPEKWRLHRAMLASHQPFRNFVFSTTRGDGSTMHVQTSGKPLFDAKGNFLGYRGVSTDITATVRADQAEEALRKVQEELAHVIRITTLGELTASIAHEVNQPLAAIVTTGEACLRWLTGDLPQPRRDAQRCGRHS